jgi:hypothetical protein
MARTADGQAVQTIPIDHPTLTMAMSTAETHYKEKIALLEQLKQQRSAGGTSL